MARGKVSVLRGPEVISKKQVKEGKRKLGTIVETFVPYKKKKKRSKKNQVLVQVGHDRSNKPIMRWVSKKDLEKGRVKIFTPYGDEYLKKEALRDAPARPQTEESYYSKGKKYEPVPKKRAIVPYDKKLADAQRARMGRGKTPTDGKKTVQRKISSESGTTEYKKAKGAGPLAKEWEEEQQEIRKAEKVKAKAGGSTKASFKFDADSINAAFKIMLIFVVIVVILGFLSWLSSIF
jgi:hypothetical protein